ncbi:MAG TPA: leucine-rich repeat domain-containing protein [Flavilitoribacter sp.]|nr:leucine-rich repeat domain-containing protein [Flavilitoribacter sp.]
MGDSPQHTGAVLRLSGLTHQALPTDWHAHAGLTVLQISDYAGGAYLPDLTPIAGLKKLTLVNIPLSGLLLPDGLEELTLIGNGLRDWPETLRKQHGLRLLRVENQELRQLPDYFDNWPGLASLTIQSTGLVKLPAGIGRLKALVRVDLSANKLTRLPAAVSDLARLERLSIAGNRLKSLPLKAGCWPDLQYLDAGKNKLKALPDELAGCRRMRRLSAGNNGLGDLPGWIWQFGLLAVLDWSGNGLTRLGPGLFSCRQLEALKLANNALPDLPDLKDAFPYLTRLDVTGNRLRDLPPLPGGLKGLDAGSNLLEKIPSTALSLPKLESLSLARNQIQEPPADWGDLSQNLRHFSGSGNPGKWTPEALLPLRQLTAGAGGIRPGQWEKLLAFLELARLERLPERLYPNLYRLFSGNASGAKGLLPGDWSAALSFPVDRVHRLVRKAFLKAVPRKPAIGPGGSICLLGHTWLDRDLLEKRLLRLGIAVEKSDPAQAGHIVLGRAPFPEFVPSGQVFLEERELILRICQLEKATLYREKDERKLTLVREMLLSPEPVNRELAWRMLWEGGVPAVLLPALKESWEGCREGALRRKLEGVYNGWLKN